VLLGGALESTAREGGIVQAHILKVVEPARGLEMDRVESPLVGRHLGVDDEDGMSSMSSLRKRGVLERLEKSQFQRGDHGGHIYPDLLK
jgi:hypothetical protein